MPAQSWSAGRAKRRRWFGLVIVSFLAGAWLLSLGTRSSIGLNVGSTTALVLLGRGALELHWHAELLTEEHVGWLKAAGPRSGIIPHWHRRPIKNHASLFRTPPRTPRTVGWTSSLNVPLWIPVVLIGGVVIIPLLRERDAGPDHCDNCTYDLTGNESGICPECGTETSAMNMARSDGHR
jgi:hypothetical protein